MFSSLRRLVTMVVKDVQTPLEDDKFIHQINCFIITQFLWSPNNTIKSLPLSLIVHVCVLFKTSGLLYILEYR